MTGFRPFGPDHLVVLAATAAAAAWMIVARGRLRGQDDRRLRVALAAVLGVNELASWLVAAAHGVVRVPLQLCDLALLLAVWGLLTLRPRVCEVAYFWGLAGSLQATVTPDVHEGFPDYWWIKFFIGHCGVVLAAVYLAATGRVRPTQRSVWRVWAVTNLYAGLVGALNWATGANYGYLARKPVQPSLLDYVGPWPWYILALEGVALASFYLYYAPWALARLCRGDPRTP